MIKQFIEYARQSPDELIDSIIGIAGIVVALAVLVGLAAMIGS